MNEAVLLTVLMMMMMMMMMVVVVVAVMEVMAVVVMVHVCRCTQCLEKTGRRQVVTQCALVSQTLTLSSSTRPSPTSSKLVL